VLTALEIVRMMSSVPSWQRSDGAARALPANDVAGIAVAPAAGKG
jgi:hypothetical protein